MEITNARIVVGMAVSVIDEAIKALQINNRFKKDYEWNQTFKIDENSEIPIRLYLTINPPDFVIVRNEVERTTRLNITGTYNVALLDSQMNPELDDEGNPKKLLDESKNTFKASINLELALIKDNPELAPYIGLKINGLHEFDFDAKDGLEAIGFGHIIDKTIKELELMLTVAAAMLDSFRLDVVKPFLELIESVYFLNDDVTPPALGYYPVYLKLLLSETYDTQPMYAIIINYPNEWEKIPDLKESILPASAELFLWVNPEILKVLLVKAQEMAMEELKKGIAELNKSSFLDVSGNISLTLEKSTLKVYGVVNNTHWLTASLLGIDQFSLKTELLLRHSPGALMIFPDTLKFAIDLDTPWLITQSQEDDLEDELTETVREAIKSGYDNAMKKLSEALDIAKGMVEMGFPVAIYPDTYKIEDDGSMLFLTQVFILPKSDDLADASYSKRSQKFILCRTTAGRNYAIPDLAKLMKDGWMTLEHFQQVDGRYIRTIPDGNPKNNMKALFWK